MEIELSERELSSKEQSKNTTCGMDFGNVKLLSWILDGDEVKLIYRVEPFKIREGMFTNRMSVTVSKDQFLDIAGAVVVKDNINPNREVPTRNAS